jgi:hypothetical protein
MNVQVQSTVIGSDQVELSLGKNDGGREYLFARLPLPDEDLSNQSVNYVRLAMLHRLRTAIDTEIERLENYAPQD